MLDLGHATTAYGVQGATVDASHTMLSRGTTVAGVYVGMTRGREQNRLHVVAHDLTDARGLFIETMERDRADLGFDHATAQAVKAALGFVSEGPMRFIADELARLDQEAERVERQAERWEHAAVRFDAQRTQHRAEVADNAAVLGKAEAEAERVRAEVIGPPTVQAEADGATYLAAIGTETVTSARLSAVGRLGRRKARAEHQAAAEHARTIRAQVREVRGGEPPHTTEALLAWTAWAAVRRAETDPPRMSDADGAIEAARAEQKATMHRHQRERMALLVSEYGAEHARANQLGMRTINPNRNAHDARTRATLIRVEAEGLRGLPVAEAAQRIEAKRAEE